MILWLLAWDEVGRERDAGAGCRRDVITGTETRYYFVSATFNLQLCVTKYFGELLCKYNTRYKNKRKKHCIFKFPLFFYRYTTYLFTRKNIFWNINIKHIFFDFRKYQLDWFPWIFHIFRENWIFVGCYQKRICFPSVSYSLTRIRLDRPLSECDTLSLLHWLRVNYWVLEFYELRSLYRSSLFLHV